MWDRAAIPLFVGVTAAYLVHAQNRFVYDDYPLIEMQARPASLRAVFASLTLPHWNGLPYYRPLSRFFLAFEQWIFGRDALLYHVVNALLMGVAAVLVRALLSVPDLAVRWGFALVGAALLALHPVSSEAVYAASIGPETLCAFLAMLGAVYAWIMPGRRALAVAMMLVALLFKEQAVALPLLFFWADACDVSYDSPRAGLGDYASRFAPVAAVGVAWWALHAAMVPSGASPRWVFGVDPSGPFLSLLYTLQCAFAPTWRLFYEPVFDARWSVPRALVALAATGGLVALAYRGDAPVRRAARFWGGWLLIAILPTANFFRQETRFAERYVVLALPAFVGLACALASAAWSEPRRRTALSVAVAAAMLGAAATTLHRGVYYRDYMSFLTVWRQTDPVPYRALASIGEEHAKQRRWDEAARHYRAAIDAAPSAATYVWRPLGQALEFGGHTAEAIEAYENALRYNANEAIARARLGALTGGAQREVALDERALRTDTERDANNAASWLNLGVAADRAGRTDEAIANFRRALEVEPRWESDDGGRAALRSRAHYNLGRSLALRGQSDEAIAEYRAALRDDPNYAYAHTNLALLLETTAPTEAITHLEAALRINPDLTNAREALDRLRR